MGGQPWGRRDISSARAVCSVVHRGQGDRWHGFSPLEFHSYPTQTPTSNLVAGLRAVLAHPFSKNTRDILARPCTACWCKSGPFWHTLFPKFNLFTTSHYALVAGSKTGRFGKPILENPSDKTARTACWCKIRPFLHTLFPKFDENIVLHLMLVRADMAGRFGGPIWLISLY